VSTVSPAGGFDVVFAKLYSLSAWQRSHSDTFKAFVNSSVQLYQSLIASGGADLGADFITVTLTDTSDKPVEIIGTDIVDRKWSTPWAGTLVSAPSQGYVSNVKMTFDLDRMLPIAESGTLNHRVPFFAHGDILLPPGVPTTVIIVAETARHAVSFRIEFEYVVNGAGRALVVGRGPKPFVVSAINCNTSRPVPYQRTYSLVQPAGIIEPVTPGTAAKYGLSTSSLCQGQ
jgi:hypothetical protein